ncbi:RNA polymerase sigma-70 factor [Paucibacter sp. R3-3]|uniref:RNA polymerase sigma-70 factor n=1 Tax=Roseateles agri TaxID=3098619 RepID=A0ABU5DDV0_9BURK|nr:RNA polymerase sigma-70 factor [Paucibacter sp. R3-3]MDY0743925.1 RNA polymerase sigma-70 factor [Paucibacter sp. R3-3]
MNDTTPRNPDDDSFNRLRPRLQGIAYRMLGAAAEAEDVVQDAWLRWHGTDRASIDNTEAWLVAVTTRIAIDRLRSAKTQREHYVGTWLPEPLMDAPDDFGQHTPSPEQLLERADNLSVAFLTLLERLAPEARAAYLLREVFDADYAEVAEALGKSEQACRQIVHRAKAQLKDEKRPRQVVPHETHLKLLRGFADAATRGEFAALKAMLAEEAQLVGDGGGFVPSFGRPLEGGQRIAQLYLALSLRHREGLRYEVVVLNGEWGLLRFVDGALESAQSLETDGEHIVRIHSQRNPEKLARIARMLGRELHVVTPPVTNTEPGSS